MSSATRTSGGTRPSTARGERPARCLPLPKLSSPACLTHPALTPPQPIHTSPPPLPHLSPIPPDTPPSHLVTRRYMQAALATPEEWRRRSASLVIGEFGASTRAPLLLYDGEAGGWCPPRPAAWSDHYNERPREPEDVTPAPWVLAHYMARAPARVLVPKEARAG